jgi:Domain of unknown function (DUF4126)
MRRLPFWGCSDSGQRLANGWVIAVASALYAIEFFADKIPWLDSAWDVMHTFIRVPAGAVIAAAAFGEYNPAIQVIAFLLGGGLALGSHATKAGTRSVINLSPEPISNTLASVSEDAFTISYVWLAYFLPGLAVLILVVGVVAMVILLPRIVRFAWGLAHRLAFRIRGLGRVVVMERHGAPSRQAISTLAAQTPTK